MLDELGVLRPEVEKTLNGLRDIPVDIEPQYVTANELPRAARRRLDERGVLLPEALTKTPK